MKKTLQLRKKGKKKLDVIMIAPLPPRTGGSAFVNNEIATGLSKKGHNVRCIAQFPKETLQNSNYDLSWRGTGVEVYPIESPFVQSSTPLTEEQIEKKKEKISYEFRKLIDQNSPDVLLVGHESLSFYANDLARKKGIPSIQSLHGTPTHMIDEGVYPDYLKEIFLDSINKSTLVVGVSKHLTKIMNKYGINHTTYIHNGVDTKKFKPRKSPNKKFLKRLGLKLEDKVVMHASTLRPIKNPLDIVFSAQIALREDPNLKYVIVGDGKLKKEMIDLSKDLGVYENFRFVGNVNFAEIPEYFRNSQMFLLPSEQEGFGRVIREAQASGSVSIASNIPVMEEVINNEHTGLLFKKGDYNSLAETVLGVSENEEKRKYISMSGLKVAIENNLNKMIKKYENVLKNPLAHLNYFI